MKYLGIYLLYSALACLNIYVFRVFTIFIFARYIFYSTFLTFKIIQD